MSNDLESAKIIAMMDSDKFVISVKDGIIRNHDTGEIIDEQLMGYQRTPSDGYYTSSEATCGGACEVGKPKQSCIERGCYSKQKCSVYFADKVGDDQIVRVSVGDIKKMMGGEIK